MGKDKRLWYWPGGSVTDPELQLLPEEEPPLEPPLDEPPLLEPPLLLLPLEELPPISRPPEIGLPAVPEPGPAGTEPSEDDPEDPAAQPHVQTNSYKDVLELPYRDMVLCWEELAASTARVMH